MQVSVVIPTLNEEANIRACIDAARRDNDAEQVEIIVADGGSHDRTLSLIPHGVKVVRAPLGRGIQMNHGAREAHGDILIFCHADTQLPQGWRESVIQTLGTPGVSGGAFQIAYLPAKGILHQVNRMRFRGSWITTHGDRAQFMSRESFDDIGGFPEIPLMEDVEMSRALHQRGKIAMVPKRVIASSRRYLECGPLAQYGLSMWLVFRYVFLGASPEAIARAYRSSREHSVESPRLAKQGELYERARRTQRT